MIISIGALTAFFVLYALLHSLLASGRVKRWLWRVCGDGTGRWYRLAYNIFAGLSLLPLFPMLLLLPDRTLYVAPSPWRWVMMLGQVLALGGLAGSLWQTGLGHFLGLSQLLGEAGAPQPGIGRSLSVSGFYAWVRHPLYSFSILFLWLTPAMTVNLLTTYLLFTLYFYVGSIHEESRLVAQFGASYRDYQRRVPRLIPWPGRSYSRQAQLQTKR